MKISCLLVSHQKPDQVGDAVASVLSQTHTDWELLIMDSGALLDNGFTFATDKRIAVYHSHETDIIRATKAMAPWCFNECFRRKLVTGDLVCYLCDDDIYYPTAFATFNRWAERNPNILAWYASEDVAVHFPLGRITLIGERNALEIGGRRGYPMDCRVDYLQFCHRTSVLHHLSSDTYWPEGKDTINHADGVFMDRIGAVCDIYPIPKKIGQNRRCANSTHNPLQQCL